MTNEIIERSLERLIGDKEGDLLYALRKNPESMGRSHWKVYPCIGANFFYDSETGEIKFFDNYTPNDKLESMHWEGEIFRGTFRMAVDIKKFRGAKDKRIVEYFIDPNTSETARHNIEETVMVYNERQGFEPEVA